MKGNDVLHPMGWDAFGLPAEQHAIKTGTHPAVTTRENIATFKRQLKSLGFSYDWSREIDTTDPRYVRWTQWIFLQLFKKGLAYQDDKVTVNWCPALGTVLANEEVVDGLSEVGGHPVERVKLRQWMMRITAYADRLADDLALVDWPKGTLTMQREWIGRSEGARIVFRVDGGDQSFEVFTTRPDTLMGCTYCVLAPEHPLVPVITGAAQRAAVDAYVVAVWPPRKSGPSDRTTDAKKKTGVPTGAFAVHPISGAKVPIWVADYVIGTYGTGAVMAVPAHDERDFAFARKYGLPIVAVVSPDGSPPRRPRGGLRGGGGRRAERCVRRPPHAGHEEGHGGEARLAGARRVEGHLQAPRLGLLAAAVLGRAHPDLLPGRDPGRPAPRRPAHHPLRPAHRRRGERALPLRLPEPRRLPPGQRPGVAPWLGRSDWRLLPEGRPLVRARNQHHAAVGGIVLVLPPLHRPGERRRGLVGAGLRRVDAGRPLRSAALSMLSSTCSTRASGTRCSSISAR